jgi:hypothetical protein
MNDQNVANGEVSVSDFVLAEPKEISPADAEHYLRRKIKHLNYIAHWHQQAPRNRMYRKSNVIRQAHALQGALGAVYYLGLIRWHDDLYIEAIDAVDAALNLVGAKRNP